MPTDPPQSEASSASLSASLPFLAEWYGAESREIRQRFEARGAGRAVLQERAGVVDGIVARLYRHFLSSEPPGPENLCLAALGGYGRRELFPHSDIDLLFLTENERTQASYQKAIGAMVRGLWDLRLRVGHSVRTLAECGRLHRDNLEFNVATLDARYLAGDPRLFARLHDEVIPHLVARDHPDLLRNLAALTSRRHAKHGHTIFHLEPNLKEAPGGLRDYHVCRWLTQIAELEKHGRWATPEELWAAPLRAESSRAFEFLATTRCFLHYLRGRDENQLTYEWQDQAAARGVGQTPGQTVAAADWMRDYFRHARSIDRLTARLLDETLPAQSGLYGLYQDWRSRVSNADFAVIRGRVFARLPSAFGEDRDLLLRMFEMLARHALELSPDAERAVEQALARGELKAPHFSGLWEHFRQILTLPYAAGALRVMHRLGLLGMLFPEFRAIDSLVIRDFYHRYTVDQHTFMSIQNLHALRVPRAGPPAGRAPSLELEWKPRFAEILSELEQPELLFLSLLFHDVGKGLPGADHIRGSLRVLEAVMTRLNLAPADRETARFLISHHLEMSATLQRRDVFDPETVRTFAEKVGTPERLKMLCLITYADTSAVSPEALTPWKAELLWQLYAATWNCLTRSVDEGRLQPTGPETAQLERILSLVSDPACGQDLLSFLKGFPRRYLATHPPEEVAAHFQLARRLAEDPVQVDLRIRDRHYELTVVTPDRPFLFASLTGTLAAWGMNIVKADAFANTAGVVLDTFRFVDLYRTLEMNPSESERFKASLVDVLRGKSEVQKLLSGRLNLGALPRPKITVPTQVRFDNASSSHSTLLELIAQDRPGLLYQVSSKLAELGCNIEVALIDTEGQKAIDVFYLTSDGSKLDLSRQEAIREALLQWL